jgi:hypothetical protein
MLNVRDLIDQLAINHARRLADKENRLVSLNIGTGGVDKVSQAPYTSDPGLTLPFAIPATTTTFYAGQAIGRDANGNMVQMDDTAKAEFIGFIDNVNRITVNSGDSAVTTNGVPGPLDKYTNVTRPALFTALIAGPVAGGIEGKKVWWLYNNQVQTVPGNNANFAGWIVHVPNSTHVAVLPPWQGPATAGGSRGIVTAAAAAGTTLTKFDINKVITLPLTSNEAITLPLAAAVSPGDTFEFLQLSSNSSVPAITPAGSDKINGSASAYNMSASQYATLSLRSDGVSNWYTAPNYTSGTTGATSFTGNVTTSSATIFATDNVANTLGCGPNGTTNPVFTVDCSVSSAATGINIIGRAAGAGVTLAVITSGTNEDLLVAPAGSGGVKITSPGANALAVGRLGATTPAFQVDASTATCVTGMKIKAAASGGGCAVSFIGGTNEVVTVDTNGSGALTLQSIGTGNVLVGSGLRVNGGTGGLGYGVGVGGTVTQITSKATGVTLSKLSGQITLNNAALNTLTTVSFILTNTTIAATDTLSIAIISGETTAGSYIITASEMAAGSCKINVFNATGGSLSEAVVFQFNVIKGAIT